MTDKLTGVGLLLSDELMFNSRILGTAQDLGLRVEAVRTQAELEAEIEKQQPCCVILDLANPDFDVNAFVKTVEAGNAARPFLVAYGSHVDVATLKNAREAGCDLVLPRSKFVEELPMSLAKWFAGG